MCFSALPIFLGVQWELWDKVWPKAGRGRMCRCVQPSSSLFPATVTWNPCFSVAAVCFNARWWTVCRLTLSLPGGRDFRRLLLLPSQPSQSWHLWWRSWTDYRFLVLLRMESIHTQYLSRSFNCNSQ